MAVSTIPLLAAILLSGLAIYNWLIHPLFISPISRIPAIHWSSHISRLWILNKRRQEKETPTIHAAHGRLGPIVRLAPNEISVNSVDGGIRTIYAGGYPKGDWYQNVFSNYNIMPMFAMPEHAPHSKRKRMLSNIYAKSTLQSSKGMDGITRALLDERLLPKLRKLAASSDANAEPVEFYFIFCAITMDFVSSYVFGLENGANFTEKPAMGKKFFYDYKARQRYQFWPQDVPQFTKFMSAIGLRGLIVPDWVRVSNNDIEAWIMSMTDSAEKAVRRAELEGERGKVQDWPNVYAQLRNALLKESNSQSEKGSVDVEAFVQERRKEMASEMLDHTLAGFDTSSITLTFLAWELSRPENTHWQEKLRAELAELKDARDAKDLDALPILHAILMETLRLHAAIPGNQPRVTPANATLGAPGHELTNLPANIRVQAQAWSLHRNPTVFPSPSTWDPARWLSSSDEQLKEMQRWFWAFGSGGRMCVGSNLAMLDMKAIVAGIWAEFRTEVVDGSGMVHNGGYVAEPVGKDGKWVTMTLRDLGVNWKG